MKASRQTSTPEHLKTPTLLGFHTKQAFIAVYQKALAKNIIFSYHLLHFNRLWRKSCVADQKIQAGYAHDVSNPYILCSRFSTIS